MATESKQIDGVVDDPENGGLKSGPCLIAGFHALSCTSPSYYNPYRGVNKNTLSVDMVRLSLTFKGDRGEWLSRKGAQLTDCDEMSQLEKEMDEWSPFDDVDDHRATSKRLELERSGFAPGRNHDGQAL